MGDDEAPVTFNATDLEKVQAVRAPRDDGLTFKQAAKLAERHGMVVYPITHEDVSAAMPPDMWDECQQQD
jgi:hypothetical protein